MKKGPVSIQAQCMQVTCTVQLRRRACVNCPELVSFIVFRLVHQNYGWQIAPWIAETFDPT